VSDIEVRTLAELEQAGDVCHWPRSERGIAPHHRVTRDSDTTKKNMGRRQNPKCSTWMCNRRVDAKGDAYCRVCVDRCWT
jgi:hypothetical protein